MLNPDLPNPQSSPGAALLAIGKLYADATLVSDSVTAHLRRTGANEPAQVRAFMLRTQMVLDEFRRAVNQVEASVSEHLHKAMVAVVKPS